MEKYRPGETVQESGEYTAYSDGGRDGGSTYLEKGETFPPTQHEGSYYVKEKQVLKSFISNIEKCRWHKKMRFLTHFFIFFRIFS